VGQTSEFLPTDQVCLSLTIAGRPASGNIHVRVFFRGEQLTESSVDLASTNSGILYSFGQDTTAGFTMTYDRLLPVSASYRFEVSFDGRPLGVYPFRVVPPPGATPARFINGVLARGSTADYQPVEPTSVFRTTDQVHVVLRVDFGVATWIEPNWFVNGTLVQTHGAGIFTSNGNATNTGFDAYYLPTGGWPPGQHQVAFVMNDAEVARYAFTIVP
jgi:hypothetical protein